MTEPTGFARHLLDDLSHDDFMHVLRLLRMDIERLLAAMNDAVDTNDASAFKAAAHGLAGAASTVGAEALEQASHQAMTDDAVDTRLAATARQVAALAQALLTEITWASAAIPPQ